MIGFRHLKCRLRVVILETRVYVVCFIKAKRLHIIVSAIVATYIVYKYNECRNLPVNDLLNEKLFFY